MVSERRKSATGHITDKEESWGHEPHLPLATQAPSIGQVQHLYPYSANGEVTKTIIRREKMSGR